MKSLLHLFNRGDGKKLLNLNKKCLNIYYRFSDLYVGAK